MYPQNIMILYIHMARQDHVQAQWIIKAILKEMPFFVWVWQFTSKGLFENPVFAHTYKHDSGCVRSEL